MYSFPGHLPVSPFIYHRRQEFLKRQRPFLLDCVLNHTSNGIFTTMINVWIISESRRNSLHTMYTLNTLTITTNLDSYSHFPPSPDKTTLKTPTPF